MSHIFSQISHNSKVRLLRQKWASLSDQNSTFLLLEMLFIVKTDHNYQLQQAFESKVIFKPAKSSTLLPGIYPPGDIAQGGGV